MAHFSLCIAGRASSIALSFEFPGQGDPEGMAMYKFSVLLSTSEMELHVGEYTVHLSCQAACSAGAETIVYDRGLLLLAGLV